jgi:hypothetical protein
MKSIGVKTHFVVIPLSKIHSIFTCVYCLPLITFYKLGLCQGMHPSGKCLGVGEWDKNIRGWYNCSP